jgi:hypothetical protein
MPSSLYVTSAGRMVSPSLTIVPAAHPGLAEKMASSMIRARIDGAAVARAAQIGRFSLIGELVFVLNAFTP